MSDDEDPLVWALRNRRTNALRVLGVGALLLVVGAIWLVMSLDFETVERYATDNTGKEEIVVVSKYDPRLFSGAMTVIGGLLAIAGTVMFIRARGPITD